jgi:hypothetical protein
MGGLHARRGKIGGWHIDGDNLKCGTLGGDSGFHMYASGLGSNE